MSDKYSLDDISESHPEKLSQIFSAILNEIEDPQEQKGLVQDNEAH